MRSILGNWEYLRSLPKTLIFNFKYFPLKIAIKLPVFISHRVLLKVLSGEVKLGKIRTGIVKIGFGDIPLFDSRRAKSVFILTGVIVFEGAAEIGPGCQLGIAGELVCGDGLAITAYSLIATKTRIRFGKNVMVSWDVSVMDHDWHEVCDQNGTVLNPPKPISVGNDVWICCKALLLKGCSIPQGVVVAAGTTVTGCIDSPNVVVGQPVPLKVLKSSIRWRK